MEHQANPLALPMPNFEHETILAAVVRQANNTGGETVSSNFFDEALGDYGPDFGSNRPPSDALDPPQEEPLKHDTVQREPITDIAERILFDDEDLGMEAIFGRQSLPEIPLSDFFAVETPSISPFASSDRSKSLDMARSSFSSDANCCNGTPDLPSKPTPPQVSPPYTNSARDAPPSATKEVAAVSSAAGGILAVDTKWTTPIVKTTSRDSEEHGSRKTKMPHRPRKPNRVQTNLDLKRFPAAQTVSPDLVAANQSLFLMDPSQAFASDPLQSGHPSQAHYGPYSAQLNGFWSTSTHEPPCAFPQPFNPVPLVPLSLKIGPLVHEDKDKGLIEVEKNRVEKSFTVSIHFSPIPQIQRIRLQSNNLWPRTKKKATEHVDFMSSSASSDTLELCAAVVRTSVIGRREGLEHALRAAANQVNYNGETETPEDKQEIEAGIVVKTCGGCCFREHQRVSRKKDWNEDQQKLWYANAPNRVFCFEYKGERDIVDLHRSHPHSIADGKSQLSKKPGPATVHADGSVSLSLPARILCYNRHLKEDNGYNIIVTVKDCQGTVLAQAISKPIIIMDQKSAPKEDGNEPEDKVTHAFPSTGYSAFQSQPSPGRFIKHAHAFSAPDLQSMSLRDTVPPMQARPISPADLYTQGMITPDMRSRPASPSFEQESSKRRRPNAANNVTRPTYVPQVSYPAHLSHPRGSSSLSRLPLQRYHTNLSGPVSATAVPYHDAHGDGQMLLQSPVSSYYAPQPMHNQYMGNFSQSMTINNVRNYYPPQPNPTVQTRFENASIPSSVQPSTAPSSSSSSQHSRPIPQIVNGVHNVPANDVDIAYLVPTLLSCEPDQGEVTGGSFVEIHGRHLMEGSDIYFGGVRAIETFFAGEKRLLCKVPPSTRAGAVPLSLDYPGACSEATFTYTDNTDREEAVLALKTLSTKRGPTDRRAMDPVGNLSQRASELMHLGFEHGNNTAGHTFESSLLHVLDMTDWDDSPYVADFDLQRPTGQGLLHFAAFKGQYRFLAGLLARGANPNLRDSNGMTPMHLAAMQKQLRIVRKLRTSGADPGLRSLAGHLPVDMAPNREMLRLFDTLENELPVSICPTPLSVSRRGSSASRQPSRGRQIEIDVYNGLSHSGYEDSDSSSRSSKPLCLPTVAPKIRSRRSSLKMHEELQATGVITDEKMLSSYLDTAQVVQSFQRTLQSVSDAVQKFQAPGLAAQIQNMQAAVQGWPLPSTFRPVSPSLQGHETAVSAKMVEAWGNLRDRIPSFGLSPPSYDEACPAEGKQPEMDLKAAAEKQAQVDAVFDGAAEARFGDSCKQTNAQRELSAPPMKITRKAKVRNDKRFWFWWLPLLFLLALLLFGPPLTSMFSVIEPVWWSRLNHHDPALDVEAS